MSRARSKRIKDIFTILTYVISIAFAIGIQFLFQSLPHGEELSSLEAMLKTHGALLSEVGKSFPPAIWAAKSLVMAGSLKVCSTSGFSGIDSSADSSDAGPGKQVFLPGTVCR